MIFINKTYKKSAFLLSVKKRFTGFGMILKTLNPILTRDIKFTIEIEFIFIHFYCIVYK
jgi:hypothetical protein